MPKKTDRLPAEVIASIGENSSHLKDLADGLSDRIKQFEDFLGKLKGRVEATAWRDHPDADATDPLEFGLRFHRAGKDWIISHANYHPSFEGSGRPLDWKPLSEAPIKLKIFAIRMFPDLLTAIEDSQDKLAKEIGDVCSEFDTFVKTLPADGKERQ